MKLIPLFSLLALITILTITSNSFAVMDLGVGYSSYTSGQQVPSMILQVNRGSTAFDFTATGYASQYDYLSGYSGSYYTVTGLGSLLSMDLDLGFGGGVYFSERGYREVTTDTAEKQQDTGLGPAFFIRLNLGKYAFIRIQSLMGIGHANNLAFIFQDTSNLSLGVRW